MPVQLGRAQPATPTPAPTPTAVPPPPCANPSTVLSNVNQQRGPGDALTVSGQLKSNCTVAVDVTLFAKWLDGPEAAEDARAFTTVRRVQPGEVRPFSEVVPAQRGASKVDLSADVATSVLARRR